MRTAGRRVIGPIVFAMLVVAALLAPGAATPVRAATGSACDRFGEGVEAGRVTDPDIDEVSGVVAGRVHRDVLWVHNDSGADPVVYALGPTGSSHGAYRLAGAENIDWEDIAIGPGPRRDVSYLYVGDIGANFRQRDHVTVYRVPEPAPAPGGGTLKGVEALRLRYPGGIVDAEALVVDPVSGDLYILTKERGFSRVMRASRTTLRPGEVTTMEEVATFPVGPDYDIDPATGRPIPSSPLPGSLITGADVSPDGSTILVRTYQAVLAYTRPVRAPLEAAFDGVPCRAPHRDEIQGEAVGFSADGSAYFTLGEGLTSPLHRFPVTPPRSTPR